MARLLARTAGAIAVCVGFYFLTRNLLGPVVWVMLALVIGVAFSRILIDALAELGWGMRVAALGKLSGHHYEYQKWDVQVWEDESHCRWVPTARIREIVGNLASDQALAQIYPSGWQALGNPPMGHLRDDALVIHLAQASLTPAIKFKNWAERNINFPAEKMRKRMGVHLQPPTTRAEED